MELCLEEFLNSDSLPTVKALAKEIDFKDKNDKDQNVEEETQTDESDNEQNLESIVAQEVVLVKIFYKSNIF